MKTMVLRQLSLALVAAGVLAGCSFAPTYQRPAAPVVAAYPDTLVQPQGGQAAVDIGWREFFPDQRLQALITTALEENRDLRITALRIEEARAQYNLQSADRLPSVNAQANGSRSRTPGGCWSATARPARRGHRRRQRARRGRRRTGAG